MSAITITITHFFTKIGIPRKNNRMNFTIKTKKNINHFLDKPRDKKRKNQILAKAHYMNGKNKKFLRAANCGSYLEFKKFEDGSRKLHSANFCRARLCPMCNWRLSKKRFSNLSATINHLHQQGKHQLLFLTLTQRNCKGIELKQQIKNMLSAWRYMSGNNSLFKRSIIGWFRALEITYNQESDTYHPHVHIVLAVKPYYFKSDYYITQSKWVEMWQKALKVDYVPVIDIRKEYKNKKCNNESTLLNEVSKYATKDTDYLMPQDMKLTAKIVGILDDALRSVRLIAYGGKLKAIYEELKLDEESYKDDYINNDLAYIIERYYWSIGFQKYVLIEEENFKNKLSP